MLNTRRILLPTALAACLCAATAGAVTWFPSETGPIFMYGAVPTTIWGSGTTGTFGRVSTLPFAPYISAAEVFSLDAEGDVLFESRGYGAPNMPDPDITTFDPPLKYLDFPLETGKAWQSTAATPQDPLMPPASLTLTGTVRGPATVSVPAGTFDVMVVDLIFESAERRDLDATVALWLHPQLGPINGLVSWTGIVNTPSVSWGSLKAGFR